MRERLLALALCWLALPGSAGADPAEVRFNVKPGGGAVVDVQTGVAVEVVAGAVSPCEFSADNSVPHAYRITRPPFDPLDFSLTWEPASGQWRCKTLLRDTLLTPQTILGLSRTVHLNVSPEGAEAYVAALVQGKDSDRLIDVSGARFRVTPLFQVKGMVTLPDGWHPEPVYMLRSGFEPLVLQIPEGALDVPASTYPAEAVPLRPLYGPFSYASFNLGLVFASLALVGGWYRLWRPRRLAEQRLIEVERQVGAEVLAGRPQGDQAPRPARLTETTVTGEGGTRYILLKLLGEGGMGVVYEGMAVGAEEQGKVAVKLLVHGRSDTSGQQRFLREVRICQTLQHPSIVKVIDWGLWQRTEEQTASVATAGIPSDRRGPIPFMIMELLSGKNLRQVLEERGGPIPPHLVVEYLAQTLQGLRVAHAAGVIHRDVKPENLMVTRGGHIKIMDFGVAHDSKDNMTKTNHGIGTPLYMSPEHFNAKTVCPASDIYSLGMVGFELLAGQPPHYEGDTTDVWSLFVHILTQPAPNLKEVNPSVPDALAAIISRMIDRELENRYPDCTAALEALKSL